MPLRFLHRHRHRQQHLQHQQQLQQVILTNQFRNQFPYHPFNVPGVVPLNLTQNLGMAPLQSVLPIEPPKAPREHAHSSDMSSTVNHRSLHQVIRVSLKA